MSVYQKDSYNKDMLLSNNKEQVMMEWEKPYMEASIDALQPRGDVLEIGFGLGYSATQIMKHSIKSYTIVECDKNVIYKIKTWAKNYPNTLIHIIEGRWQEKIHTLGIFDEIYFDDYPLEITKESNNIDKIISGHRLHLFIELCIQHHTRIGSRLSFYLNGNSTTPSFISSDATPFVTTKLQNIIITIPNNCKYRDCKEQQCTIPLVTKIKDYDAEYAFEMALKIIMEEDNKV